MERQTDAKGRQTDAMGRQTDAMRRQTCAEGRNRATWCAMGRQTDAKHTSVILTTLHIKQPVNKNTRLKSMNENGKLDMMRK